MSFKVCDFLVASCVSDGGIFQYSLFDSGSIEQVAKISLPSPMFFHIDKNKLTVLMKAPFENSKSSGICVYDLCNKNQGIKIISTLGEVGCHLCVCENDIYCANYTSGSVFKLPNKLVEHKGSSTDKQRQASPHVHSVFPSPDKRHLLCCDLGTDEIYIYDRELFELGRAKTPDGSGPRHLCFSKNGKLVYCINEMSATVSVFSYDGEELTYLKDISIKPKGFTKQGKAAAIKITESGRQLYMTERGSKSIVLADICTNGIQVRSHFDCHGDEPRDIALVANENFLICANQFSDNISVFNIAENGNLEYLSSLKLPSPICIEELR